MSTNHVSGVLALIKSANLELGVGELKEVLLGTAIDLSNDEKSDQEEFGAGMVNAEAAVLEAINRRTVSVPTSYKIAN